MSDLNFNNPIILVPTVIIGIGVLGAVAYGIKSLVSGNKSDVADNNFGFSEEPVSDNETVYSSEDESVRSPSLDSYESVDSNGAEFRNPSISSDDSTGGSRKKRKGKGKKTKKSKSKKNKSKKSKSKSK
jgi:hypothetical protein